jgi:hypothetical protein
MRGVCILLPNYGAAHVALLSNLHLLLQGCAYAGSHGWLHIFSCTCVPAVRPVPHPKVVTNVGKDKLRIRHRLHGRLQHAGTRMS